MSTRRRLSLGGVTPVLVALGFSAQMAAAGSIGFQRVIVPDSDDKPRDVGIWYPSKAPASSESLGPYRQTVALDGATVRAAEAIYHALPTRPEYVVVPNASHSSSSRAARRWRSEHP